MFSDAIATAKPVERLELEQMMSVRTGPDEKIPALLEIQPEYLLEWCHEHPDFAPQFLAKVIPILTSIDGAWVFGSIAMHLIDEFGSDRSVLSAIAANMGTFSWSGSLVPYYKRQEEAFNAICSHKNPTVREWVEKHLSFLREHIDMESRRDQEEEWGIR